jgi:hypothetical protein
MTDLFVWGGPVTSKQPSAVQWERPTKILTVSREGSSANQQAYQGFAGAGAGWPALAAKAGISPDDLGSLGIGGFSAFHGFAGAMLSNPEDRNRIGYVHLADACFQGTGARTPKAGYLEYAIEAARGDKLLVATSNGPWDQDIHYCYDYPDERGHTCYSLTSGSRCIQNLWEAASASTGVKVTTPQIPPAVPAPSLAMQMGNFLWFHYEPTVAPGDSHGFHVRDLATPYIQFFGAPWMARRTYPGMPEGSGSKLWYAVAGAAAAAGALLAWRQYRRSKGRPNPLYGPEEP